MYKVKGIGPISQGFSDQEQEVSISTDVFDFSDTTPYKVFWQVEPEEVMPNVEQTLIDNWNFYNLILSWNERVLAECPNSIKFVFGTCRYAEDPKDDADVLQKKFQVSYLTSNKRMCPGHTFRHDVYHALPPFVGKLPVVKYMSPPEVEKKDMMHPFQFSIVMENVRRNNWFTEKLVDALVSRTIPVYWGAPNIAEYFNLDGILAFENYSDLTKVLGSLSSETYQARLKAVEENLHKAMQYTNHHRRIDEEIRRRLSENHTRTSEDFRTRQEVRKSVLGQQSTQSRRLHR